jgi:acyl-CoA thioester hydrolase
LSGNDFDDAGSESTGSENTDSNRTGPSELNSSNTDSSDSSPSDSSPNSSNPRQTDPVQQSQIRFKVRYAETDAMGIAHHSNYVIWFEMGRVDFLDQLGIPYSEVERRGVYLVVTSIGVKYRRPARFDDTIILTTRLSTLKSRMVRFDYALEQPDGRLLAEGFSEHIATDFEKRAVPIPHHLREALTQK